MTKKIMAGKVITFYSYKGGTGRSMALANIACLLSQRENARNVLMIDWDLEAPGLHRYFQNQVEINSNFFKPFESQEGLIDLFYKLNDFCNKNEFDDNYIPDNVFDLINIDQHILHTKIPSLFLMTAGKFDKTYAARVANFDWNVFYSKYPSLILKFAEYLSRKFDYVLIDSRTGHTDISGICTTLMPDRLIVVFTPNNQSLSGVLEITRNAIEYRKQSDDLRQLVVFPLVSRVEPAEPKLREDWRFGNKNNKLVGYQPQFEDLFNDIYGLPHCDLTSYFDDVQLQYVPRYAYGEEIAVLSERSEDRLSLARSYESFVQRLTQQIRPWDSLEKAPSAIDKQITEEGTVELRERSQTIKRKASRIEKTIFICYRRTNFYTALAVYQDLTTHGYDVFFDYQSIPSGDFEKVITENIKARAHFIVLLSPTSLERCDDPSDWMRREIEIAIENRRNIIPLMMESFDFDSPLATKKLIGGIKELKNYNGLRMQFDFFFDAMEKLRQSFLNVALNDVTISPITSDTKKIIESHNIADSKRIQVKANQLAAQGWVERGFVNSMEIKNYEEAETAYRKAIELDPLNASAYYNLGNLLSNISRYIKNDEDKKDEAYRKAVEAEVAYRKAIELDPADSTAYASLGNLLLDLERYKEAEAAYRKAIELDPKKATTYSNLGNLLLDLKRYEEAEAAYRKAIEFNPTYATAYYNLGSLLSDEYFKRYEEAEVAYRKATELDAA